MEIRVRITSRHAGNPQKVHREERPIHSDKSQCKMPLLHRVVHLTTKHLWIPELNRGEHTKQRGSEQHIVEVSHDEVGVMEIDIHWHCSHEDPAQSANYEQRNERRTIQEDRIELNVPIPNCSDPVENLDRRWESNHHGGCHEGHAQSRIHPARKHVMSPHNKT